MSVYSNEEVTILGGALFLSGALFGIAAAENSHKRRATEAAAETKVHGNIWVDCMKKQSSTVSQNTDYAVRAVRWSMQADNVSVCYKKHVREYMRAKKAMEEDRKSSN